MLRMSALIVSIVERNQVETQPLYGVGLRRIKKELSAPRAILMMEITLPMMSEATESVSNVGALDINDGLRKKGNILMFMQVNDLKPHPLNDTIYDKFDPEVSADLIESIKINGLIDPIIINQDNVIISGHRRWEVHKILEQRLIECTVVDALNEKCDNLLIEYNRYRTKTVSERMREASVLIQIESAKAAKRRYIVTDESEIGKTSTKVAETVGMKTRTFNKAMKVFEVAKTNKNAESIMKKIDAGSMSIDSGYRAIRTLIEEPKPVVEDTDPPPDFIKSFTSWQFADNDPRFGQPHPGRIPGQIAGNLIWYLTKPGDMVIDPMAGGGSTIDVARFLKRQVIGYDINPLRPDVIKHDITKGYPRDVHKPKLIFIDPPYWNMVVEDYSDDAISNNTHTDYLLLLNNLIMNSYNELLPDGFLAIINMSSYYRLPPDHPHYYTDWPIEIYNMMRSIGFTMRYRIAVTYPTTLYGGFHINQAREKRWLLPNLGDIIVGQKGA